MWLPLSRDSASVLLIANTMLHTIVRRTMMHDDKHRAVWVVIRTLIQMVAEPL